MIKQAIFDIDGTLFDEKSKCYPASAVAALSQLQRRGIGVIVATGRPPSTRADMQKAGIAPNLLICANGHLVLDAQGHILLEKTFSAPLAQAVCTYCAENGIGLLWKYPGQTHVYFDHDGFQPIYRKNGRAGFCYGNCGIHLQKGPAGGCLACGQPALEAFNSHFAGQCRGVDIDGHYSDLMLWSASKASALAWLLAQMGLTPDDCIAFGDNLNDLEIIMQAGVGVCMGNGVEQLKVCSDYVTDAVDRDGIAHALTHFRLIEPEKESDS